MSTPAQEQGFFADVQGALRLWRGNPVVPALYLLLSLVAVGGVLLRAHPVTHCVQRHLGLCPTADQGAPKETALLLFELFVSLPVGLFQLGLSGASRVWYVRRLHGERCGLGEIWLLSWRFLGRFLVLGLLVTAVSIPAYIVVFVLAAAEDSFTPVLIGLIAFSVIVDVALTFVTPWLALFEPRPTRALRAGLQLIRASWPRCLPYALVPPLALVLLAQTLGSYVGGWVLVVPALLGPPLTLACSGATTFFLQRRYPPPPRNGSLDLPAQLPMPYPSGGWPG